MLRALHKTIKKVTEDYDGFKFNTAIASMMELVNAIYQGGADKHVFSTLVLLISPIAPHFAEELWQVLGATESITQAAWPQFDPAMLIEDVVTIVVQVNGKVRGRFDVALNMPEADLKKLIMADEKMKVWFDGKEIRKCIVVPNKIVNIVKNIECYLLMHSKLNFK